MAKYVDLARCAAVKFSLVKFLATESRKENVVLEAKALDSEGKRLATASVQFDGTLKAKLAEAGFEAKVCTEKTVRLPIAGIWQVAGLRFCEGDKVPSALQIKDDYDVVALSDVVEFAFTGMAPVVAPF
jgi:hypothetical protein